MTAECSSPRAPLKICQIAATTEGAVWLLEQLRELRDRHGYEVAAILNGEHGTLVEGLRSAGIAVHATDFDFTSNADLLGLPRKVIRLVHLLKRERFDVIQTHLFHSMVIGRIAAWFADVPVRFSMIAGPFHLEAYTPRWIDRLTCWTDTAIIASCEHTRTLYRKLGVPQKRLALIYYGPDESKFDPLTTVPADLRGELGWSPDTPLIGMIAYFYPALPHNRWIPPYVQGRSVKSQEDLIRAAPLVLREFPQAKFLLIGSGWEEEGRAYMRRMQSLVAELGLEQSVIFTGFRKDIPAVLRAIDIAVQPSLSENLGGTIESLLMECPTVATRIGGMPDAILDGKTGVLVEPSDPQSLADGILRLLRDPPLARRYGAAGRERMLAGFTLRRTVDGLADLYGRKFDAQKAGYRPLASKLRMAAGSLLCLIILLRYCLLDAWILRLWDQGWRPWHNPLFLLPARLARYCLGKLHPSMVQKAPASEIQTYLQHRQTYWKHITLYRFYAFVGRHPIHFGVRRRIAAVPLHARHALVHLKHLTLYRLYAFIGRHQLHLDARRRIAAVSLHARHAPIHLKHLTLYRLYAFIGRHQLHLDARRRIAAVPLHARHALIHLKHLTLYRGYAFLGRHSGNFGVRRHIAAMPTHASQALVHLKRLILSALRSRSS